MRRRRTLTLLAAAAVLTAGVAGAGVAGAAAPEPGDQAVAPAVVAACGGQSLQNTAGGQVVRTTSTAVEYTNTTFASVQCGGLWVYVPRGKRALIAATADAEVTCTGVAGQWCLGRVLIGGVEGEPAAPEPDSFSWAHGDPSPLVWESNAFTRTRTVTCPATAAGPWCPTQVVLQTRNHAAGYTFRVDDLTLRAVSTFA